MVRIRQSTKLTIGVMLAASLVLGACGQGGDAESPNEAEVNTSAAHGAGTAESQASTTDSPPADMAAPATASDGPFNATADSGVSVTLEWDPIDGASGYTLELSILDEERLLLASLDPTVTVFEDFGALEGFPLTYHLTAKSGSGDQSFTVTVSLPSSAPNPYSVEPVLSAAGLSGLGFDPSLLGESMPELADLGQQSESSATIGPEGGEVVAVDGKGTTYRLDIPTGALSEPLDIVMTPVESLGGFPFSGGIFGAVQIEPQGTPLAVPARLTIEPAGGGSSLQTADGLVDVAFAFDVGGGNFHLTPFLWEEAGVSGQRAIGLARPIERPHPAGPLASIAAQQLQALGAGQASPAEVAQFAKGNPPEGARNRAAQKAAARRVTVFPDNRETSGEAPDLATLGLGADRLRQMARAAKTCEQILTVYHSYEVYVSSGESGSVSGQVNNQILDALASKAHAILQAERKQCLSPGCAEAMASMLLTPQGQGQTFLGEAFRQKYASGTDSLIQDLKRKIDECGTYRVNETPASPRSYSGECIRSLHMPFVLNWSGGSDFGTYRIVPDGADSGRLFESIHTELAETTTDYAGAGSYRVVPRSFDEEGRIHELDLVYQTSGVASLCTGGICSTFRMDADEGMIPLLALPGYCPPQP